MLTPDPGSFRDPASRVVLDGQRVLRLLDTRGLEGWRALSSSEFFERATADGRLISSRLVDTDLEAAAVLEHPRLPLITYPYEWTFSMLKDAALLQLDLLDEALGAGLTMKDATPYNIQFEGTKPVFIDIGSFEPYRDGEPWIGYRQFTRQFLFPLMLRAWIGVPFQPWLRGDPEGPTAREMANLLPSGAKLRPAAALHVSLQARMEERMSGQAVRESLQSAGFSAELIRANVGKLRRLIEGMSWDAGDKTWSDYVSCSHVERDRDAKSAFLEQAMTRYKPKRVLDLGANDAHFTRIAAERGSVGVAVDGDEPVLDAVYRSGAPVSVVLTDLTNPSPSQGWAGEERPGLMDRVAPDLVIAYGLIHHLIYTASIPPKKVCDWLASLGTPVVLEYVSPDDAMVEKLTANKLDSELHAGTGPEAFRALLNGMFAIDETRELDGGTRTLFALTPR